MPIRKRVCSVCCAMIRSDRQQVRLRRGPMWRLHRLIDGQPTRSCITLLGKVASKQIMTIEGLEKMAGCIVAGGIHQGRCDAMRLLHVRNDHVGSRAAGRDATPIARSDHRSHGWKYLSLWDVSTDHRGDRINRQVISATSVRSSAPSVVTIRPTSNTEGAEDLTEVTEKGNKERDE